MTWYGLIYRFIFPGRLSTYSQKAYRIKRRRGGRRGQSLARSNGAVKPTAATEREHDNMRSGDRSRTYMYDQLGLRRVPLCLNRQIGGFRLTSLRPARLIHIPRSNILNSSTHFSPKTFPCRSFGAYAVHARATNRPRLPLNDL